MQHFSAFACRFDAECHPGSDNRVMVRRMSDLILVATDGAVATLTLNRPDKLNVLDAALLDALEAAIERLSNDVSIRVAVLTGAGEKAFAAGADIAAMVTMSPDQAKSFSEKGQRVCAAIEDAPFPVIGAINGFALGGGCEIALACDFLHASERAKFAQPEVKLAVIPGFGGTQRLARRVGLGLARELCYTGAMIDAQTALRIGLVNAVHAPADLLPKVRETAAAIVSMGPCAITACKRVLLRGADIPLAEANDIEGAAFAALFATSDQRVGMEAFLAKRPAQFQGK
jgi:enoyl-CoA hydratase